MNHRISQPPERTATAAELAGESARGIGCQCGAPRGYSCDGEGGMHLQRFAEARRLQLVTEAQFAAALAAAGGVFTPRTIVARQR